MAIYLLHLNRKLHHAQHYIGYTENLSQRLNTHAMGRGSKMLRAAALKGISWQLVRVWTNVPPSFERQIKRTHSACDYCPVCMGDRVRAYKPKARKHATLKP